MQDLIFLKSKLYQFLRKNQTRRKVVIVNSHDKIQVAAEAIKSLSNFFAPRTTILCVKLRVPEKFSGFEGNIAIPEDYLSSDDYLKIDDYVFNVITRNWDAEGIKRHRDIFTYRDVELGRVAEYDLQLYLLAKIKALALIDRAIKKEKCEAIFIIDSNKELDNFDKLLKQHYHITADFADIAGRDSFSCGLRRKISLGISGFIDSLAAFSVRKRENVKLIDAKLFYELGTKTRNGLIPIPLEQGLKLRLKCFFANRGYIAFDLDSDSRKKPITNLEKTEGFNIRFLANIFVFEDIPYWLLVEDKIKKVIAMDFNRFKKNIDILIKVRNKHGAGTVVLRNDVREIEKTIVLSAKKNDIKTLVVQHGIVAEFNGHHNISADKIAVWGNRAARWYERFGNDSKKIVTLGNPKFDRINSRIDSIQIKNFTDKLGFKNRRKYLVTLISTGQAMFRFTSFLNDDVAENIIRSTVNAIKSIKDVNLVIKLHPNERIRPVAKLVADPQRDMVKIIDKVDLYKLLAASDLIVTFDSSVGLKAIAMKKPVVVTNLSKRHDLVPYVAANVAIGAYSEEDVEGAIRKALYDEDAKKRMDAARKDFVKDFVYKIDGKAKERIAQLIKDF